MLRWSVLLVISAGLPAALAAQDSVRLAPPPVTATLTLDEALQQAREHNPVYRQALNNAGPAGAAVVNAYGNFIPQLDVGASFGYTGAGQSQFGGTVFDQSSPSYNSGYDVSLSWVLNGQVLTAPGQAKASRHATDAEINAAAVDLRTTITVQYLTALQAAAQVGVARQQVQRADEFLQLARARYEVGQATLLDVRQAQVEKGTADVALLRAIQAENEQKLELLRQMGVEPPVPVQELALTDSFPVTAPDLDLDRLLATAAEQNPTIQALEARETATEWDVRAAKSQYLPSLSISAGWSGFTQEFTDENLILGQRFAGAQGQYASCQENNVIRSSAGLTPNDCAALAGLTPDGSALRDDVIQGFRAQNNVFPFDYTGNPFSARLTISLPIFTGFSRPLAVSQARERELDAEEELRASRLQLRTQVHSRLLAVETAFQAIEVQEQSRAAARDQLRLAQDRYRLGSGTSLELAEAQAAVAQAEGDYVNAVYDYHIAIAQLEAAIGQPLR